MLPAESRDWLTLLFLPGLGCSTINRLIAVLGSPQAVLRLGSRKEDFSEIGDRPLRILTDQAQLDAARRRADQEFEKLLHLNISLLPQTSPLYPDHLLQIHDPPLALFYRGDPSCLSSPVVALIGSRACSDYGRRVSGIFASELAARGVTVISGVAYGIDGAAHKGALAAGGKTAGVLGCGLDVVYPGKHGHLYESIAAQGVLLSEYPLATRPDGFRFPARNRIISGLASAVVVVEATEQSGSLITARLALDQGRDVFAVPGRVDSVKSSGTHRLIQQGAYLVHSVQDIFDELEIMPDKTGGEQPEKNCEEPEAVHGDEARLLDCLDTYPLDIDTIIRVTGFDAAAIHGMLLHLELSGRIRQLPGQLYERVSG